MERNDLGKLLVLSAEQVDDVPWNVLGNDPGVKQKTLWQAGSTVLGLMRVEPGHENAKHVHQTAQHHILITQGSATILGHDLTEGSYLYIPPGTPHGVEKVGEEGVTFFYTYRPIEGEAHLEDERGTHPAVSDAQAAVAF